MKKKTRIARMTRICRLCLNDTTKLVDEDTPNDYATYKTKIELLLPEIDLNVTPIFVLCNPCLYSLDSAYTFKNECLRVEQRINDYRQEFNAQFINLQELKNQQLSDNCKELLFSVTQVKTETLLDDRVENDDDVKNVDVLEVDLFQHLNESNEINNEYKIADKNDSEGICSESFQQSSALKTHLKTHTKQSEYTCGVCCKVFTKKYQFIEHTFTHTDKKRYYCKVCNKGYNRRSTLRLHEGIHKGIKYDCSLCTKSFTGARYLKNHQNSHFGNHECETCGLKCGSKYALEQHVRRHTGDRPYKCEICGKGFKQNSTLTLHIKCGHMGHKPHVCEVCGKAFAYKTGIIEHKMTHTDNKEKKFFCPENDCNRSFSNARYLRKHVRGHTLPKDFKCSVCEKGFKAANGLRRHIRTHTGEKPFECNTCHKTFSEKYNLQTHLKSHRPKKSC